MYIYRIGESADRAVVGGKGASLSRMKNLGLNVPDGITLSTQAWRDWRDPDKFEEAWPTVVEALTKTFGAKLPLVSVRSGARDSMPGMMSTIINIGTNEAKTVQELNYVRSLALASGTDQAAIDAEIDEVLESAKVFEIGDLSEAKLGKIIKSISKLAATNLGVKSLPTEPLDQIKLAIRLVFDSWDSDKAKAYREERGISHDEGTACTIQRMVFGLNGGSGVYLTRDPSTGAHEPVIDWAAAAQGDDVVSGSTTPLKAKNLLGWSAKLYGELIAIGERLEKEYRDAMDIEFTIDDGKLYILQCRTMKRTPLARVNILMSLALEGLIDRSEFLANHIEPISTQIVQAPAGVKPYARGVPISGSFLTGKVTLRKEPEPGMILFRNYTETDDLPHMLKAQAIVTSVGGPTCHAALVARDFNIPAIVGTGVKVNESYISNGVTRLLEGALVTITPDGSIYEGQVDFKTETMISVDYERYLRLRKLVEG